MPQSIKDLLLHLSHLINGEQFVYTLQAAAVSDLLLALLFEDSETVPKHLGFHVRILVMPDHLVQARLGHQDSSLKRLNPNILHRLV